MQKINKKAEKHGGDSGKLDELAKAEEALQVSGGGSMGSRDSTDVGLSVDQTSRSPARRRSSQSFRRALRKSQSRQRGSRRATSFACSHSMKLTLFFIFSVTAQASLLLPCPVTSTSRLFLGTATCPGGQEALRSESVQEAVNHCKAQSVL